MNSIEILSPQWEEYQLIDCGDGEKLERWGRQITVRPEPQAVWRKSLPEVEWNGRADAVFRREEAGEERGEWRLKRGATEQWVITQKICRSQELRFRLGLTAFKHVGLFPEQAENWDYIYERTQKLAKKLGRTPKILNLFAYTGGATMAAAAAGGEVTHVDSVKQVVGWARENATLTGCEAHWVAEDATKFVQRELRRGHHYEGIILDPPAYGRGANGEKWVLERDIAPLLEMCGELLAPGGFVVLNLYSMGLSAVVADTLARQILPSATSSRYGELVVTDTFGKQLPLGVFWRGEIGEK